MKKPWKKEDREEFIEYYRRQQAGGMQSLLKSLERPVEPAIIGTIILVPVLVVIVVIDYALGWVNSIPGISFLEFTGIYLVDEATKVVVLIFVSAFLVTGIGRFVRTETGFAAEKMMDRAFDKIPIIGTIYNITKVTVDTVFSGADEFREPVKLDFNGVRLTAFRTGNRAPDGRKIVFLPTAPNITSGLVLEVEEERLIRPEDEDRKEALSKILSAGFGKGFTGDGEVKREVRTAYIEEEDDKTGEK
jgi:uncharacterized membrane protein